MQQISVEPAMRALDSDALVNIRALPDATPTMVKTNLPVRIPAAMANPAAEILRRRGMS